jgi:hypothetical protein
MKRVYVCVYIIQDNRFPLTVAFETKESDLPMICQHPSECCWLVTGPYPWLEVD